MLLAGDVGGTKTNIGVFSSAPNRPAAGESRSYRTVDFPNLGALALQFLREIGTDPTSIEAACFGVAGPIDGQRAQLTNVRWAVDLDTIGPQLPSARTHLLNDLEALAWSIDVLQDDEIEVLQQGTASGSGSVALIAAGTGLGVALLPRIGGQLVPRPSEGGHVDFAARNEREHALQLALIREYGRAQVEHVVSGPGLATIHRLLYPHQCATLTPMPDSERLPEMVSRGALEAGCPRCLEAVEVFVGAYGAVAGNLALTALSTGGIYLGGGIAPRILRALRWPLFLEAFRAKSPMEGLLGTMPVTVILNPAAGLLGAARFANLNL